MLQELAATIEKHTKLDKRLASGLLWTLYLSFPICIIVAIRRHDRFSRQQMIQFVAQAAMLERIWQSSQAD